MLGVFTTHSSPTPQTDCQYLFLRSSRDVFAFFSKLWMFCIISMFLTNLVFILLRSSLTLELLDMAGIHNGLSTPLEEGDDRRNTQTAILAVQQTWNKADSLWNCKDQVEEPEDLEYHIAVSSPCQPGLNQHPELCEMLHKRCRWFDEVEMPQPSDTSTSTSSHQHNRSRILPTTASSLMDDESDCDPPQTQADSSNWPKVTSASTSRGLITVLDQEENILLPCKMFKIFLQNPKVASRRNATCEELEMVTGFVKVNGSKFSLWHLRNELRESLQAKKK